LSLESLEIAVVGLGKMGLVHSSIINVLPKVQLTALCEKSSLIRKFSKKLYSGVHIVDDVKGLSEFDLDAVYVTTPIPSHFGITKAIYTEKIARNIFVEKTLAQQYAESEELSSLAGKLGGVNMVGYLRRFYVTFRKAKELLLENSIGNLASFRAYAYSSDFCGMEEAGSRGGVLRDLGCYPIDLALWFFGELRVHPEERTTQAGNPQDPINFELMNHDGLVGHFSVSWRMPDYRMPEVGFSISGSKGEIAVDDDKVELKLTNGKSLVWYRHDLNDNVPFYLGLPEYYREDAYFIDSIIKSRNADPDFHAAAKVDEIIGQVEEKAGENDQHK
jgi:predicted dehydrogenase